MFLGLQPNVAVITNVEWDHVDCYPNEGSYQQAFADFAARVTHDGTVIYCGDDPGARLIHDQATKGGRRWISYGFTKGNKWRATELTTNPAGGTDFLVERHGFSPQPVGLAVTGAHNVLNALATLAAITAAGCVFTKTGKNLKFLNDFMGTTRRLEQKGISCDIIVLDDYAHHPTEVRATLSAVRQRFPRRAIWVLFQPHTFSRTRAMLDEFCSSLKNADHVLISDIYAAREHDTMGVSAQDLIARLDTHPDARYAGDLASATARLLAELKPGDVLLTIGAGDGNQVGDRVLAELRARERPHGRSSSTLSDLAATLQSELGVTPLRREPLAAHTTMRVGGPAELFITVNTLSHLMPALELAHQAGVPSWVLGGGSNVIVSDSGFPGLVIANACRGVRQHEGYVVWAESGANLGRLARQTLHWGLGGLEWAVSVPGTLGGAVVGNAGAHGGCIADNLLRATLLLPDGKVAEWPASRFHFAYRHSLLKQLLRSGQPAPLVLAAAFQLIPSDRAEVEERAARFLAQRRTTQPSEPSAGSIFQNPPGDYAGRILDSLGFRGRSQGDAMFSTVHANFIVNRGHAKAADVIALIDQARQAVWAEKRIELLPEVLFVGDWTNHPPYQPLAAAAMTTQEAAA
jgi:UDP-N-acetylenolpyruvoylglucosamine reductase